jgi:hypothetical protein
MPITKRFLRLLVWIGIPAVLIVVLVLVWRWDWFIPLVDSAASATLGREVRIGHLHVGLGRIVRITADDVRVANPEGWPQQDPPLATIRQLTAQVDAMAYIRGRSLVIPLVAVIEPHAFVAETPDGKANYRLAPSSSGRAQSSNTTKIGNLQIDDGAARVEIPRLKADFALNVATRGSGEQAQIVVDAKGTYAGAPITGKMVGGALLSLRDTKHPWPIDASVANGPTHLALNGTIEDPLALKGANLKLRVAGPDMGLLEHLIGFPIPKTPPYEVSSKVAFAGGLRIRLEDFSGRLGSSDIDGTIAVDPGKERPEATADLHSNRVDLADLAGVIGAEPGRATTPGETRQQKAELAQASAGSKLLPDTPISLPRLTWADIHLQYRGNHIEGRSVPLDNLTLAMDLVNGRISVHPIAFGVGFGKIKADADLAPVGHELRAHADIQLQRVDVARLMAATHTFNGAGAISGAGAIETEGNSFAAMLGNGNGEVKMAMAGGNLSALLVDLSGLEFGNALLSALGMPQQTAVSCFIGDFGLRRGIMGVRALVLDTGEAIINGGGDVDLRDERINLWIRTASKHFSIGSLPADINIGGTLKKPSILPGGEIAARGGAAVGLGVLFAPLALLPTIQFGTSEAEDQRCGALLARARHEAGGRALPAPGTAHSER